MLELIITLSTSFLTYFFINQLKLKKLISSALSSLIFCLFFSNSYLILGASFVSMGNFETKKILKTFLASLIYFIFFQLLLKHMFGLGGALGTLAFLACLITNTILSKLIKI